MRGRNLPGALSLSPETGKRVLFACYVIISYYLFCHATISAFAMDQGGCLTCHRYRGLVKFEKPAHFKGLYIDEERFLKSVHGTTDCRRCHTKIVAVPHTGKTEVDCNSACHRSRKEYMRAKNYPLKDFHKNEQSAIISFRDASSCRVCHPAYPHTANVMVRALLNMHTLHMTCEVCHIKREEFDNLLYEWVESEHIPFTSELDKVQEGAETARVEKTGVLATRIAVFAADKETKWRIMNTRDAEKASEFMVTEQNLRQAEREKKLRYFHRDIARKGISVACDECHSQNSILNFSALGFDRKEANNLIHLDLKGLVTKYETFYFPDLFGR
jgi:hypothetical protein